MKKGWLFNLLLLVVVIGLGLYAYLKPGKQDAAQHPISTTTPAQVTQLTIDHGGVSVALEKKDNLWRMTAPLSARADASQVNRVLDVLGAKSKEKLAASDLKRFDLDKPLRTVQFNKETLAFGMINSLTQDQYILNGQNVFLIPAFYGNQIPGKPDRLLTHSLFAEGEKPVGFQMSTIAAAQKDGKWIVERRASKDGELSQDDLNRWADDWRLSSSLLTQPYDGKPGLDQIQVKLSDGRSLQLEILQKEPDLIVGRVDEKLQFQYSSEAGKRLLEPKPEPLPPAATDPKSSVPPAGSK